MLSTQLYLLKKNKSYYSITIVAMPSFLAGTRNLMMTDCWMHHLVADIGAYIEIRSLVLARDDAVGSTVLLLCGCIPYSSVHQECGARHCTYFA